MNKDLYQEGLKFYPYLEYKETVLKNTDIPVFRYFNQRRNKGSYSEAGFVNHLVSLKLNKIAEYVRNKGVSCNYSNTTNSIYFTNGYYNIRISDHSKQYQLDITIGYKSCLEDIYYLLDWILNCEYCIPDGEFLNIKLK